MRCLERALSGEVFLRSVSVGCFSYTCSVNFVIVVCMFLCFPLSLDFGLLLLLVAYV